MTTARQLKYINLNVKLLPSQHTVLQYSGDNSRRTLGRCPMVPKDHLREGQPTKAHGISSGLFSFDLALSPVPRFLLSRQQSIFFSSSPGLWKMGQRLFFCNLLLGSISCLFCLSLLSLSFLLSIQPLLNCTWKAAVPLPYSKPSDGRCT